MPQRQKRPLTASSAGDHSISDLRVDFVPRGDTVRVCGKGSEHGR